MAREIERKFLVTKEQLPPLKDGRRLIQGYLSDIPHVRFRIIDQEVHITIKKELNLREREELEFVRDDMNDSEIEDLISLALWPPLVKTRYEIEAEGRTWEIDVYKGENEGLVTADVEISDPEEELILPLWVDIEAEVTGDPHYANITLTRRPYSTW